MQQLSVVVMCHNEADVIGYLLQSVQGLSDDIVVYDNGSTDSTLEIARSFNASIHIGKWKGYGKTRIESVRLAKYDWILIMDADESLDEEAQAGIKQLKLDDNKIVYSIKFKNFFGTQHIRFGEWGKDRHIRVFNKRMVNCDLAILHEKIVLSKGMKVETLQGNILHRTIMDLSDYIYKTIRYALLWSKKNKLNKNKFAGIKMYLSPPFTFIKYYFLKLGFIDGRKGFVCACMSSIYTFLKYSKLYEEQISEKRNVE